MREILFKARTKDTKQWVEGDLLQNIFLSGFEENPETVIVTKHSGRFEVDPRTVCEYTGLNIEGKRVFENDILSFWYYGKEYTGYVAFINGAFCVWCDICAPYLDDVISRRNAKIIGNVYDEEKENEGALI